MNIVMKYSGHMLYCFVSYYNITLYIKSATFISTTFHAIFRLTTTVMSFLKPPWLISQVVPKKVIYAFAFGFSAYNSA